MQKVYLIEDETLLRELIGDLLEDQRDLEIIGTSGDGKEGYEACMDLRPHLVILDIKLPTLNGIEVAQRLKSEYPWMKVLVFSSCFSLSEIRRVIMAKVNGIIEKSAGLEEMRKAIRAVASGQSYYGPKVVQMMPDLCLSDAGDRCLEALTSREREVLQLIAEGYTNKEIADKLGISSRTADAHRYNMMQKLDLHNVAGLTRFAAAFGLVALQQAI